MLSKINEWRYRLILWRERCVYIVEHEIDYQRMNSAYRAIDPQKPETGMRYFMMYVKYHKRWTR